MGLHRGPGLRRQRRRDIPRAGPRQQKATPRDGPAPGTGLRQQEVRHPTGRPPSTEGDPARWTCTGDRPPPAGGETSHGQAPVNRRRRPHVEVSRQQAPNRAMRRETPPRLRHTEARRDTPVVPHPITTAVSDDFTPLLCNIWSSAGPDALTEWSPIHLLPQAGTI
jgi:hypothetical protein